jgi:hypothetical protein
MMPLTNTNHNYLHTMGLEAPIIIMQVYVVLLLSFVERLPESARWFVKKKRNEEALKSLKDVFAEEGSRSMMISLRLTSKRKISISDT